MKKRVTALLKMSFLGTVALNNFTLLQRFLSGEGDLSTVGWCQQHGVLLVLPELSGHLSPALLALEQQQRL